MTDETGPDPRHAPRHALDRLHRVVAARKGGDPEASYTAKLYARGVPKIAQKVGEEAVETVIEAVRLAGAADRGGQPGDGGGHDADARTALVEESADLLYHLTVLWAALDIDPAEVWAVLDARHGTSGFDARKAKKGTAGGPG